MAEDTATATKADSTAGKSASKIGTFFEKHKKAIYILAALFVLIVIYFLVKPHGAAASTTTNPANQNPTGTSPSDNLIGAVGPPGPQGDSGPAGLNGPAGSPGVSAGPSVSSGMFASSSFFSPASSSQPQVSGQSSGSAPIVQTAAAAPHIGAATAPTATRSWTSQAAPRSAGVFGYSIPSTPPVGQRQFGYSVGALPPVGLGATASQAINVSVKNLTNQPQQFGYSVAPRPASGAFGYSVPHQTTPPAAKPAPVSYVGGTIGRKPL